MEQPDPRRRTPTRALVPYQAKAGFTATEPCPFDCYYNSELRVPGFSGTVDQKKAPRRADDSNQRAAFGTTAPVR